MATTPPALIVSNQTSNPAFAEWLHHLKEPVGAIEFWCSNAPPLHPSITVQTAMSYNRSTIRHRLWTWGRFTLATVAKLLFKREKIPLFVVTNPPFMVLGALLLHRLQKRPFALLEWDIYPQILIPMGLTDDQHIFYRLWYRWHRHALQSAGLIIAISDSMADTLRQMTNNQELPVKVIPNWTDTEWIQPVARANNPFAQEQQLDQKLVVLYSGNLGATHAIETILATAEILRDEDNICFLFIGNGSKRPLVENAIAAGKIPTARLLPPQSTENLPYSLSSADVGIVTLAEGYQKLSMPSKTYGLLAAGAALLSISDAPNDLSNMITTHQCGVNFAPTNPQGIAHWLRGLLCNKEHLSQMQNRARQTAVSHFSKQKCEKELTAVVQQWLQECKTAVG